MIIIEKNERKKKKKQTTKKIFPQIYKITVNDWERVGGWMGGSSRGWNRSGFIVLLCKVSLNTFLHDRLAGFERGKKGKGGKSGVGFGIYNLAWRNTVTSRHHINLCRCPYMPPVCPSMLPNMQTPPRLFTLLLLQPSTQRHKQANWLLTDRISTHPSTLARQECTNRREAHSLVSRFFSFHLLCRHKAFIPFAASLSARMKITPSNWLRCKITSGSPLV